MRHSESLLLPTGHFLLKAFRRGILVDVVDEPNLIVNGSKTAHARLLGGDVTNRSITKFACGTSGTAPAGGNTSLTGAFSKAIDAVSYPDATSVKFDFSLLTSENNGMAILEFGLLTAGDVLYARKVRSVALNKDVDLTFSGSWTITF
ncbi:hypothetical protein [Phenylobacterium ferrooxidans]|uniref:Phage tail protein n=1 Tax=Phenylobacterium ferrooxidans TaxID=2982689 RepID=A0ABW6CJH9_9CAUL